MIEPFSNHSLTYIHTLEAIENKSKINKGIKLLLKKKEQSVIILSLLSTGFIVHEDRLSNMCNIFTWKFNMVLQNNCTSICLGAPLKELFQPWQWVLTDKPSKSVYPKVRLALIILKYWSPNMKPLIGADLGPQVPLGERYLLKQLKRNRF